jgi:hypothetical protein
MSAWTHTLCADCWRKQNPDRNPVRVRSAGSEPCCACKALTADGIYVRADPTTMTCKGKHG